MAVKEFHLGTIKRKLLLDLEGERIGLRAARTVDWVPLGPKVTSGTPYLMRAAIIATEKHPLVKSFRDQGATHATIDIKGDMHFYQNTSKKGKAYRPLVGYHRSPL